MATEHRAVEREQVADWWMWIVAIAFLGIGDLVSTSIGLSVDGVYEAGPLTAVAIQHFGLASMVVLKLALFAACYALWRHTPRPHRLGVPLGLAVAGVAVTGWNLHVLLVALLL